MEYIRVSTTAKEDGIGMVKQSRIMKKDEFKKWLMLNAKNIWDDAADGISYSFSKCKSSPLLNKKPS